jgi:hypothetical protein
MQLPTAWCLSFWLLCVQERLVANKDVTQLVAMLSNPSERLPAMLDYLHEHLQGAEHMQVRADNRHIAGWCRGLGWYPMQHQVYDA